jgi:glutathione S-transferase
LNPLGKMPVLVLDDGEVVYDSVVIVDCLEGIKPAPQLIPTDFRGRIAVRRWEALADGIAEAIVNISHQYGPMNEAEKVSAASDATPGSEDRARLMLIERSIVGREWLHGEVLHAGRHRRGLCLAYARLRAGRIDRKKLVSSLPAAYAERLMARPSSLDNGNPARPDQRPATGRSGVLRASIGRRFDERRLASSGCSIFQSVHICVTRK